MIKHKGVRINDHKVEDTQLQVSIINGLNERNNCYANKDNS
jgi:hypothetical protein